ncbi:phospholipase D zeta 1-like isoform X1 [Canna indica]|uniref:Phospholipase n=1 Tax=Canna indica TaxID=4628 RepID=A0AAQ3Q4U4_9LILI|nr:phospholipase D zeta 1-like isoform X1 [Canna indica]
MSSDRFASVDAHSYIRLPSEPIITELPPRIFEELPTATIVAVSRPDASDITPLLLSYTIEFQYKQFKWCLLKKASQVLYLHLALKKRTFLEELHDKQEQVKEWLHNLGIGEHMPSVQDDDEADDVTVHCPMRRTIHLKAVLTLTIFYFLNRNIPSVAALPIISPSLGGHQSISDRAKVAMQAYLNHFFGNLDIVNSQEVCKFLEVSRFSFLQEYGPKLKEGYVTARHLPKVEKADDGRGCCACHWFSCCNGSWQKVWAVLKPGFLALLENPFDTKILDIIVFDVLPQSNGKEESLVLLAKETKKCNPLHFEFQVFCGSRIVKLRMRSNAQMKEWVEAINDAGLRPPEGWCNPHRFGSFAPPRGLIENDSYAQWFIDGQSAFEAIASSIEEAKSEIFITNWWLCPELYLRRPFNVHDSSRLDAMLEAKAKLGVQIYILLYKEVPLALKINSAYSKRRLLNIHENVKVLRYPDHLSTGIYYWSDHEKIVTIDNQISFIGGLDLCFGRYDNFEHKVGDMPPLIWPGKDYYNPRESEPNSWEDSLKDELDRQKYPRMPWHDVQCALWGPPCRDVARHFVQRWNFAKRNKAPNEQTIPLLMPQQHMVIPHYMGNRELNTQNEKQNIVPQDGRKQDPLSHSCQDIPLLLPYEPDALAAKAGNTKRAEVEHAVQDVQMKGFVNDCSCPQTQSYFKVISQPPIQNVEWWETQERGNQVVSTEESRQVGPRSPCHCQVIRSVGQWSAGTSQTEDSIHKAYVSLIEKAKHFIYIENQFFISGLSGDDTIRNRVLHALYQRIMLAEKEKKQFRVIIVLPLLPGFQGSIDDGDSASVRAIMHWQYRTICRGPNSILQKLYDKMGHRAHDFISFYGLRTYGRLCDGGPLFTNQVYVHSKLMIVDDRVVLIGSANINDRSLLGSRDSEIGVLIEDKEYVDSLMNGKSWKAGKFSLSLRLSLWLEHLGLHAGELSQIGDPISDTTYKDIWMETAKTNTTIYQEVFSCVPNDLIHSRTTFRQNANYFKETFGYTTIDLGIAWKKLEPVQDGDLKDTDPVERLRLVKGHLVSFPLNFMCDEDLRPFFSQVDVTIRERCKKKDQMIHEHN